MIKQVKRVFYPRNFDLSPEFLKAYEMEKKKLLQRGFTEKEIQQKIARTLIFH
jgi:hypothetical protein